MSCNSTIECRVAKPPDSVLVMSALDSLPPMDFYGIASRRFRQAYVGQLLRDPMGILILALDGLTRTPAGYIICLRDSRAFWLRLFLRHPIIVGRTLWIHKRATLLANLLDRSISPRSGAPSDPYIWSPTGPQAARVIFVGTAPQFRRRGIGLAMYRTLSEVLRSAGCRVVEAHIDHGNMSSLQLHMRAGWIVTQLPRGDYSAMLQLNSS